MYDRHVGCAGLQELQMPPRKFIFRPFALEDEMVDDTLHKAKRFQESHLEGFRAQL